MLPQLLTFRCISHNSVCLCMCLSPWACVWVSFRRVQGVHFKLYEILPNGHHCFIPHTPPTLPPFPLFQSHRGLLWSNSGATDQPRFWWLLTKAAFLVSLSLIPTLGLPASFIDFSQFLELNSFLFKRARVVTVICNWTLTNRVLEEAGFWALIYSFTFFESTFWQQFHSFFNWVIQKYVLRNYQVLIIVLNMGDKVLQ